MIDEVQVCWFCWWLYTRWWSFTIELSVQHTCRSSTGIRGYHYRWRICPCHSFGKRRSILGSSRRGEYFLQPRHHRMFTHLTQGGGTYGIVWSVTVKTHPDMPVTSVRLVFQPQSS